jgi:hypothetical protein
MSHPATRSDVTEEEMASLINQAQKEEKLGLLVSCDSEAELRAVFEDIDAKRV